MNTSLITSSLVAARQPDRHFHIDSHPTPDRIADGSLDRQQRRRRVVAVRIRTIVLFALLLVTLLLASGCRSNGGAAANDTRAGTSTPTTLTTPSSTAPDTVPAHAPPGTTATTTVPATDPPVVRPDAPVDTWVPVGSTGARMHVRCVGAGPSTVLLMSGFTDGGDSWGTVESALTDRARVCSYARFGTGTSDAPPAVQTFASQVADLHELLSTAGEPGPYVVVGHSFGGPEAALFASTYPNEVRGLLLLDATVVEWPAAVCAVPDDGSDAGATFAWLCGSITIPDQNPEHLDGTSAFAEAGAIADLGNLPMIVMTAAEHPRPGLAPDADAGLTQVWDDGQAHWMSLSTNAEFVTVADSGHYIQNDQPGVVIEAIVTLLG